MVLLNTATKVYSGSVAAKSVYLGATKVWSSGAAWDVDTQNYLTATGLNVSYAPALDGLVVGLKSKGLWTKMNAIYAFVGGTAALHKWNLKDPRDLDAAFRLTYVGGIHTTNLGYQPNPTGSYETGGYANTYLIPSTALTLNSTHLSLYSLGARAWAPRCDMGAYNWDGTQNRFHVIAYYTAGEFYYSMASRATPNTPAGSSLGLFVATRTSATDMAAYRNGALAASIVDASTELPYVSINIGNINGYTREYSDLPFGFASIGSGLTAQNVADLYSVIQAYQTALGRQV